MCPYNSKKHLPSLPSLLQHDLGFHLLLSGTSRKFLSTNQVIWKIFLKKKQKKENVHLVQFLSTYQVIWKILKKTKERKRPSCSFQSCLNSCHNRKEANKIAWSARFGTPSFSRLLSNKDNCQWRKVSNRCKTCLWPFIVVGELEGISKQTTTLEIARKWIWSSFGDLMNILHLLFSSHLNHQRISCVCLFFSWEIQWTNRNRQTRKFGV